MAFGNGELMQVPWETVIKSYRRKLGDKSFPRLEDYANDFFNSLDVPNPMFPAPNKIVFLTTRWAASSRT